MRLAIFLVIVPSYVPFVRMLEMQATLVELVDNFEFSPPTGNIEIIRAAASVMSPMSVSMWVIMHRSHTGSCRIKGSSSAQMELPLTITPVIRHEE